MMPEGQAAYIFLIVVAIFWLCIYLPTFIKILDFIYLFQTKEYRFDRMFTAVKEGGLFAIFYKRWPRKPALTARNILMILLSFYFVFPITGMLSRFPLPYNTIALAIALLILFPFIAFVAVCVSVALTEILAQIKRQSIIAQAKKRVGESKAIFIGLTGSYGKTSTKEFLYHILSQKFKVAKTDENMNTPVGVALSVLKNLKKDTEFFIAEAGAYKRGEIKAVTDIIHPQYGILTAIGNQHLALFGSRSNLVATKGELLESLPVGGTAYVSYDIQEFNKIVKDALYKVVSFSANQKADCWAEGVNQSKDGLLTTKIHHRNQTFLINTHLAGAHNVANLLPTIALAYDLGMKKDEVEQAVSTLKPLKNKLALLKGINDTTIMDDSYSSSIEGFLAAITTAASMPQKTKIIASKGVIELGSEKEPSYKKVVETLRKTNITLYTIDSLFKKVNGNNIVLFKNEKQLQEALLAKSGSDTLIVVEGRFTEMFVNSLVGHDV